MERYRASPQAGSRLAIRWFPQLRPNGLEPVRGLLPPSAVQEVEVTDRRKFREFLNEAALSYYSIGMHALREPLPRASAIRSEDAILVGLEQDAEPALIISGPGGIGKTRLTLELGRRADRLGWLALRARTSLSPQVFDELSRIYLRKGKLLLLLDYIETQSQFVEIIEQLFARVDLSEGVVRVVANCRSSYYPVLRGTFPHARIDLSAIEDSWLRGYHAATVEHILRHDDLQLTQEMLDACRGIPMLAVLLRYIKTVDPAADLDALRGDSGFGDWVASRVRSSFRGNRGIRRELAIYMGLLDIPTPVPAPLREETFSSIHAILADDGWIERVDEPGAEDGRWGAAHDVLADQIMVGYCADHRATRSAFPDELLLLGGFSRRTSTSPFRVDLLTPTTRPQ